MRLFTYYNIYNGTSGMIETSDSAKSPSMATTYNNPLGQPVDTYLFTPYIDESSSYGAYQLNIIDLYEYNRLQEPIINGMKARCDISAAEFSERAGTYLSFIKLGLGEFAILLRKYGEHSISGTTPVVYINTKIRDEQNTGRYIISDIDRLNDKRISSYVNKDIVKFNFFSSMGSANISLKIGPSLNNLITFNIRNTVSENSIYISGVSVPFDGTLTTVGGSTSLQNALCIRTDIPLIDQSIADIDAIDNRLNVVEGEVNSLNSQMQTVTEAVSATSKFFITR